jgi:S-adenosylmethionine:tRNA-ribosyltransferase-isomerase (queuine synthetase)
MSDFKLMHASVAKNFHKTVEVELPEKFKIVFQNALDTGQYNMSIPKEELTEKQIDFVRSRGYNITPSYITDDDKTWKRHIYIINWMFI